MTSRSQPRHDSLYRCEWIQKGFTFHLIDWRCKRERERESFWADEIRVRTTESVVPRQREKLQVRPPFFSLSSITYAH